MIDKNETSTKDMIAILRELHKYVPKAEEDVDVSILAGQQVYIVYVYTIYYYTH